MKFLADASIERRQKLQHRMSMSSTTRYRYWRSSRYSTSSLSTFLTVLAIVLLATATSKSSPLKLTTAFVIPVPLGTASLAQTFACREAAPLTQRQPPKFARITRLYNSEEENDGKRSSSSTGAGVTAALEEIKKSDDDDDDIAVDVDVTGFADEDAVEEDVVGTEFFGGSAEKVQYYDPKVEAQAEKFAFGGGSDNDGSQEVRYFYARFDDSDAFSHPMAAKIAQSLQEQINIHCNSSSSSSSPNDNKGEGKGKDKNDKETSSKSEQQKRPPPSSITYASNLKWETPFSLSNDKGSTNPWEELQTAAEFYRRIHVALVGGDQVQPNVFEIKWEMSLQWPNFWDARVLLTGSSRLTLQETYDENDNSNNKSVTTIVKQVDKLDGGGSNDLISSIASQILPRFWDVYHIGMTPSAELSPQLTPTKGKTNKGLFSSYQLFDIPPRLYYTPSLLDTLGRDERLAQAIPNHAFTTIVRTVGRNADRYVPTSPIEVVGMSNPSGGGLRWEWKIPVAVEHVATNHQLPYYKSDKNVQDFAPDSGYSYVAARRVAVLPFGGNPQDVEVSEVREELYKQVTRDGFKVKLEGGRGNGGESNSSNRPVFFFWQTDTKACFTPEAGLGMTVSEWRPEFLACNLLGIELEME